MFNDEAKLKAFEPLLVELLGGREVAAAIVKIMEGRSICAVADELEIPRATLHRKFHRARSKLYEVGLMTKEFEEKTSKWRGHFRPESTAVSNV
jgi:DNA-directed RNA polymerase specialized sigma24 family protein